MAKKLGIILLSVLCLVVASCQKKQPVQIQSKPTIVSTTAMINELVKEIAQDKLDAVVLIKGDIDPHSYELVKGDQAKLKEALCIFYQGLGLEHGASLVAYLQNNPKAIAVGEVLKLNHDKELIYHEGYLDPHVWLDLHLWEQTVPVITAKLIELQPENMELFQSNADKLVQKMRDLDQAMKELLVKIPENKRYLVTSHSAFGYFTKRYLADDDMWAQRCMAPEGLAPEAQISLYDIEKVVSFIREKQIQVIFHESNVSKDALNKILDVCKKCGLKVQLSCEPLFGDALFLEKSYLDMMWHNAILIHQALHVSDIIHPDS